MATVADRRLILRLQDNIADNVGEVNPAWPKDL
jgi:hypothetical protein